MHYLVLILTSLAANHPSQICVQTNAGNLTDVVCAEKSDVIRAVSITANDATANVVNKYFDAQRVDLNLRDGQALVIDKAYRTHGGSLQTGLRSGIRIDALAKSPLRAQRLTHPLPPLPNALVTDPRNSYRGISDPDGPKNWDPGCNTEINELYGPLASPFLAYSIRLQRLHDAGNMQRLL